MNPTPANVRPAAGAGTCLLLFSVAGGQVNFDPTGLPWLDGALHPVADATPVLALLTVGIAATLLGGRSRWGLPLMVAVLLGFGLILGGQGAVAPMLDTIVMTTALALALLILGQVRLLFALIATVTGAFALFHGVADGYMMRLMKAGPEFVGGYALTSVALITAGLAIGEWLHPRVAAWNNHLHQFTTRFHGLHHGS